MSSLKKGTKEKGPKQLSRTLMGLKFMRRRMANEEEADENKITPDDAWYASNPPEVDRKGAETNVLSYVSCMELVENGHFSFGKFNSEVEREMADIGREERGEDKSDSEKSVSDNEMAERYENLIGSLQNKIKRKPASNLDFLDAEHSAIPKKKRKMKKPRNEEN